MHLEWLSNTMQALNLERFSLCRPLGHGANYEVYDAIDRQAVAKTVSADFDLTYRPTDSLSVHFKAGWTKANGDTSKSRGRNTSANSAMPI